MRADALSAKKCAAGAKLAAGMRLRETTFWETVASGHLVQGKFCPIHEIQLAIFESEVAERHPETAIERGENEGRMRIGPHSHDKKARHGH
jgi:hypothetical protein